MKKVTLAASTKPLRRHCVLFAVTWTLIAAFCGSPALAGAPATTSKADIPLTTSNAAARQFESDAKNAYRSGNIALAITLLKKAVNAAPRDGVLRTLLGRALLQSGDAVSAERELRQARSDRAPEHMVLPTLFQAMLARHEEQKLLDEFSAPAANAQGPAIADILMARAQALLALGRVGDAAAAMDRSLSLRRDVIGLLARAQIATRQNIPSLADNLTDEALKLDPKNGHALVAKLDILVRSNDTSGALELSDRILRQFPNDISTRLIRIDIFLKLKQDDKAKVAVDAILAGAPGNPGAQYYKAVILARANEVTGAWRIAQTLPPQFTQSQPSYAIQVSQIAIASGNVETGAAILSSALAKSPDQLELRLRLADLRMSQDSPQAALAVLLPVKDSVNPRSLDLLAQVYLKLGKYSEASDILKKMQKTDPKRAISLLTSAFRLEPGSVEMMDTLGWIKLQQKDTKGALEQLTRAHSLRPKDGAIAFHLVQALDASGDRNSARTLLKALLDSGVNFDDLPKARQLSATWH